MKKIAILTTVILSPILLVACKNHHKQTYKVSVDEVTVTDNYDWKISASTNAPNNTKVLISVVNHDNPNFGNNSGESLKLNELPRVEHQRIEAIVDPSFTVDPVNEKPGLKTKIAIIPVTNYNHDWFDAEVSPNLIASAVQNGSTWNLTETGKQVNYNTGLRTVYNESIDDNNDTDPSKLKVVTKFSKQN